LDGEHGAASFRKLAGRYVLGAASARMIFKKHTKKTLLASEQKKRKKNDI